MSDEHPPTPPRMTKRGDEQDAVRAWQRWLVSEGYSLPIYGIDGDHGDETEGATLAWLKDHGFDPVGREPPEEPDPPAALLSGIDISAHQPPSRFHWATIAVDHAFVIARACYGTRPDKHFAAHVLGARSAGMRVGGYIFFRQQQDPAEQLAVFEQQLADAGIGSGDLVPAVDLEENTHDGPLNPGAHNKGGRFITEVLAMKHGAALIYLSPAHFMNLGTPPWVLEHHIWVAHWNVEQPSWPWGKWAVWQHSATYTHGGFRGGPLDRNRARQLPTIA